MKWILKTLEIQSLKPLTRNPRTASYTQRENIAKSMEKFGLIDKPIVNTDLTIIAGHQRIEILRDKGFSSVECWTPESPLSEKEVEELCIRHNRNHASWDYDILANDFDVMELLSWGFDEEEFGLDKMEKKQKPVKPTVTLEFTSKDDMLDNLPTLETLGSKVNAKLKIRG